MFCLLCLLMSCAPNGGNRTAEKIAQDTRDAEIFDRSLTFNDLVLEQADEQGKLLWKVSAKQATYSRDKKQATVTTPNGELYQDGKVVFKISAEKGEVMEDGKTLTLKGQIKAIDVQDGVEINGNELEWRPAEDVLYVRQKFTGTHQQLDISAQQGKFFSRSRRAEIAGQIVVTVKNPKMKMRTEHLTWLLGEQKVLGDKPMQIDRERAPQVIDRATADQTEYDLKTKVATLKANSQVTIADPALQVTSQILRWNPEAQTINAPQPITVINSKDQVTIRGNQGEMKLQEKIATLIGQVRGESQRNQAKVEGDRLTWFLDTQEFEVSGNVTYQQVNPLFNLIGDRAQGRLQDQQVTITGGPQGDDRVVTEIIPNKMTP
ncbi:MAG: LPS export ABC transporter periplasmic protein LptC [Synechococcales bacterium]|nr:LPS export ABC transporter periplasmic protein LptC [Synechococcales bacterium]